MDEALAGLGLTRRLGVVVAHLAAVSAILTGTDMIIALSARLAHQLATVHGLVVRCPPVPLQHTRLSLLFHRRFEADAGHAWLRRLILALARDVPAAVPG